MAALDRLLSKQFELLALADTEFKRRINDKFEDSNEIRGALADTQKMMVTRPDLAMMQSTLDEVKLQLGQLATRAEVKRVDETVEELRRGGSKMEGGRGVLLLIVGTALVLIGGLLAKVLWGGR